jgi:hypothetical protein
MRTIHVLATVLTWAGCSLWAAGATAQELTPRAYWPAPKGTRVAVFGYSHSSGDVLFDQSIPLYGVDSDINTFIGAYLQTLSLGGRTSNVLVELPYQWGTTRGFVGDTPAQGDAFGIGDLGVTLSVNLLGAPTMTLKEFQELRADPHPILGASLKLVAPTGDYNSDKLLNVGANRWALRAELGSVIPITKKWLLELVAGAWFLGDDDDFIAGRREQEAILATQLHLVRRFRPGFWTALDVNYYTGGRQAIGGKELEDVQRNVRIGATVVVPFRGRHAVKVGYSRGVVTEFGTDFRQFLVTYQVLIK